MKSAAIQSTNNPSENKPRDFKALPLVDISGLYSNDLATRLATAKTLGDAAENVGFLYVTGHGIPAEVIEALKNQAKTYFAQPVEEKMKDWIGNSSNHSGYVPHGEEQFYGQKADNKEAYDLSYDLAGTGVDTRRPMLGENQWPADPQFKRNVKAYYDEAFKLSQTLFKGFALALGLDEDAFVKSITTPPNQLRLLHYFLSDEAVNDAPGIGAHTDYECFTILLPTAPGLEVKNDLGEWIDAPLVDGAFVINIGDMMEVMSNGRFVATSHRVRKVNEERYAFPMFCSMDYDTIVEPIEAFISEGEVSKYQPIHCGNHLYSQTIQTFNYLKKRYQDGELELPPGVPEVAAFLRD